MKRSLTFLAGLLFLFVGSSCQQIQPFDTMPSAIYIPRGENRPEAPEIDESVFSEAYDAAVDCRKRSEIERALTIIREALAMGASPDWHGRLVRLEGELRRESVQRTLLDAFVHLSRARFVLGEMIEGEIVLQNISGQTIVIPATRAISVAGKVRSAKAKSILHATVAFTEYRPFDMVVRISQDRVIIIDQDIVLKPGGVFRIPLAMDSRALSPSSPTYRTYVLGGTLHPTIVRVGETTFSSRIHLRPATAHVFPRNYEHIAAAPLGRLTDALKKSATTHLPIAAALIEECDAKEACRVLFDAMNRVGCAQPLRQTIITCLRIITGERLGGSLEEWNAWYRAHKQKESS